MSTWLGMLPLEIADITTLIEPTREFNEGEKVVGELSETLRKLYTLWQSTSKSAQILEVELKFHKATDEEKARLMELKTKSHALGMIFTVAVCDDLKLWGQSSSFDVRTGWKVVDIPVTSLPFPYSTMQ